MHPDAAAGPTAHPNSIDEWHIDGVRFGSILLQNSIEMYRER
jgi:hypothetical protein